MSKIILIADDHEMNRKMFRILLQNAEYKTLEAVDGKECIRLAEENKPALILMDIQMPVMDGITAMKILKSKQSTAGIPIIALTSYAMQGDRERFLSAGFEGYISKPIDSAGEFRDMIEKIIQERCSNSIYAE